MIIKWSLPLVALVAGILAATPATPSEFKAGTIRISQPWTLATPASAKVAGGFMAITNTGKAPDRLISGSTEISASMEIHEMQMVNGIMMMRAVDPGITIKPGATVVLKPFAHHLMMMGISRQLQAGETVKGTLVFEKAGRLDVVFTVEPLGASAPRR